MIVTDRFVFVHLPKTGGTFVSKMLIRATGGDRKGLRRFLFRLTARPPLRILAQLNKHGKRCDIPRQWRDLPVIGCVRHPHDWYVSNYRFGWWRKRPESYPGLARHPSYPNLSFTEYLEASNHEWVRKYFPDSEDTGIGRFTLLFLHWFSNDFSADLMALKNGSFNLERMRQSVAGVRFLHTDSLNQDLGILLEDYGFSRDVATKVRDSDRILPHGSERKSEETWNLFYTPRELADGYERDRWIFQLFPRFLRQEPVDCSS